MIRQPLMAIAFFGVCASSVASVGLDVPYVETPADVVDLMVDMASVNAEDYVIDLGTGDGRIAIAAAKRGARALGVDLDGELVEKARKNALHAGVAERVTFLQQNLFQTDISKASVVTLFLNSEVNLKLRPVLLEQLKPGARVTSHNFDMGSWKPDLYQQVLRQANNSYYIHDVYSWTIPATVQGHWEGKAGAKSFQMTVTQEFQEVALALKVGNRALIVDEAGLHGGEFRIITRDEQDGLTYVFTGHVGGAEINGSVRLKGSDVEESTTWHAVLLDTKHSKRNAQSTVN